MSRPALPRLLLVLVAAAALLAACSRSGSVRRISEPTASIQQLTVSADGNWSVELRLQNFSSIPMRFATVSFDIHIDEHAAGLLRASPALTIGPESADTITVPMQPSADVRLLLADALAAQRGIRYRLQGTIEASPHERNKPHSYDVRHASMLSQVPGLTGVLR